MRAQFPSAAVMAVVAFSMAACGGGSSPPRIAPTVTLTSSATDVGVPGGPAVTLRWSSTQATSCTASDAWSGPLQLSGSQSVVVPQTSVYTISCSGRGGVATASVTIHAWVPPSVSLTADRTSVFPNTAVLLTWSSRNATECRGFLGLPATLPLLPTSGSQMTAPLMESTQFRIICGNPVFPSGMAEVVVKVALPKFTVLALPMDRALGLNDAGDVVGIVRRCGQAAVAWLDGQLVTIAETTPYWCQIAPTDYFCWDINAGRTAVCSSLRWNSLQVQGFVWRQGDGLVEVGGPASARYVALNDAGQFVGAINGGYTPILVTGGETIILRPSGSASAINASGHVAVTARIADSGPYHLYLYADGAMRDLGSIDSAGEIRATGINAADTIVGTAWMGAVPHAFRHAGSMFADLGSLGGTSSEAAGINDVGQIVGHSTLSGPQPQVQRAFLFSEQRMVDLNDCLSATLSVPLSEALGINSMGQIVANACPPSGTPGDCRAYLLTPVMSP